MTALTAASADRSEATDWKAIEDLLLAALATLRGAPPRGGDTATELRPVVLLDTPFRSLRRALEGEHQGTTGADGVLTGSRLIVIDIESSALAGNIYRAARDLDWPYAEIHEDRLVVLLKSRAHDASADVGKRHARRALAALSRSAARGWHAGVSGAIENPDLGRPYRDAADAAALAARTGALSLFVEDVWADLAIARLNERLADVLTTSSPLQRLADYDRTHATDLQRTVATWLSANAETRPAAAQLNIHCNTLRYRLGRAASVSGLDLADPRQRLLCQLALGPFSIAFQPDSTSFDDA